MAVEGVGPKLIATYNNCFKFLWLWLLKETLFGFIAQAGLQYLWNLTLCAPERYGGEDGRKFQEMFFGPGSGILLF